ncbi:MAG TPA: TRAP transporter small permease subunit, partial [Rubrivivax sp.]|nr:TRAP transporter small permease subunit [Rubrivivax sp.]
MACSAVASVALFGIMLLTLVDVAGRKLFSASVPGSLELTELLMVAVIFAALPLVSLAGEHIAFDSFDRWQPAG